MARDGSGSSLLGSANLGVLEVDDLTVLEEDVGLLNARERGEVGKVLEGLHDSLVVTAGGLVDNLSLSTDGTLAASTDSSNVHLELLLALILTLDRHYSLIVSFFKSVLIKNFIFLK